MTSTMNSTASDSKFQDHNYTTGNKQKVTCNQILNQTRYILQQDAHRVSWWRNGGVNLRAGVKAGCVHLCLVASNV